VEALPFVAGAVPFNDVSARDLQLQNTPWTSGKAVDTFAPCGPQGIVLRDGDTVEVEIDSPGVLSNPVRTRQALTGPQIRLPSTPSRERDT